MKKVEDLVNLLKTKYELKDSRAYELVREMMDITAKLHHKLNEDSLADSLAFMEEMKQKAVGMGNSKEALDWAKEIHKVSQLYVEKMQIEHKMEQPLFGAPPKKEENE
jgi:hypothetical protein